MRWGIATLLFIAAGFGPRARANPPAPEPTTDILARVRSATTSSALGAFLVEARDTPLELPGRILVAENAYRNQDLALAREALATPELLSRSDFVSGYGCFLLGLLDPANGLSSFARAYERAGDSLLRHRAALWMAESLRERGDNAGALALLEVIPEKHLGEAQRADLMVRRLLLLDALSRSGDAERLAARIVDELAPVATDDDVRPLLAIARQRLTKDRVLEPSARAATIRSLLATSRGRAAATESRELVRRGGRLPDDLRLLAAEAELEGGSAQRALSLAGSVHARSALANASRLLQARALIKLKQERKAEPLLRALLSNPTAKPERFAATSALAGILSARSAEEADRLRQVVVSGAQPGVLVDDAAWALSWARYLRGDFAGAIPWFGRLIERTREPVQVARGTYWAGRSEEQLGAVDEAKRLYHETLRSEPFGYYGLVAGRRLQTLDHATYSATPSSPAPLDPLQWGPANVLSAMQPARELLRLGLLEDAAAEVQFQARRFPGAPAPPALLAEALDAGGDYQKSVVAIREAFPELRERGVPHGYWTRLYPLNHWDAIQSAANAETLDPYLIAAVMYQESRFKVDARSRAGALGLMQIMPRTGRDIARRLGEPRFAASKLLEPETNIRYGSYFLRHLIDRLDERSVLALAAYNAGPGRVAEWHNGGAWDEFIESIPFRETRLYVKNILVAHAGYHRVYDNTSACSLTP